MIRVDIGLIRDLYRIDGTAICCTKDMAMGYPLYRQFNKMLTGFYSWYSKQPLKRSSALKVAHIKTQLSSTVLD
jgi:hypothetical protein